MKLAQVSLLSLLFVVLVAGCQGTSGSNGGKNPENKTGEKTGGVKIGAAANETGEKTGKEPEDKPERQWWKETDALGKGLCAVGGNIMLNAGMNSSARLAATTKAKQNLQGTLKKELAFCLRIWAKSSAEADAKVIQSEYIDGSFLDGYVSVVKNSLLVKMRAPKGGRGTLFVLMTVKADDVYNDFTKAITKANTQLRIKKKPAPSKDADALLERLAGKLKTRLAQTQEALAKEYEFSGWAKSEPKESVPPK